MKVKQKLLDLFLSGGIKDYEEEFPSVKAQIPGHPGVRIEKISKKLVKVTPCLFDNHGEIIMEGDETECGIVGEGSIVQVSNWIVYQEVEIR